MRIAIGVRARPHLAAVSVAAALVAAAGCTDDPIDGDPPPVLGSDQAERIGPPSLDDQCKAVLICIGNLCITAGNLPNGTACDDDNACTTADACHAGRCVGGPPVVCEAADDCQLAGACDPASGACSSPAAPDGTSCAGGGTCQGGTCVPSVDDARTVFVTSSHHGANLGGRAGASAICNAAAAEAGLAGAFEAVLATHGAVPWDPAVFSQREATFVRVDGVVVASTLAEFASLNHQAPINRDEHGAIVIPDGVNAAYTAWTGYAPGLPFPQSTDYTCGDWTDDTDLHCDDGVAPAGEPGQADARWLDNGFRCCGVDSQPLFCVER